MSKMCVTSKCLLFDVWETGMQNKTVSCWYYWNASNMSRCLKHVWNHANAIGYASHMMLLLHQDNYKSTPAIYVISLFIFRKPHVCGLWMKGYCLSYTFVSVNDKMRAVMHQLFDGEWFAQSLRHLFRSGACSVSSWGNWLLSLWSLHSEEAPLAPGSFYRGWEPGICSSWFRSRSCWGSVAASIVGIAGGARRWFREREIPFSSLINSVALSLLCSGQENVVGSILFWGARFSKSWDRHYQCYRLFYNCNGCHLWLNLSE